MRVRWTFAGREGEYVGRVVETAWQIGHGAHPLVFAYRVQYADGDSLSSCWHEHGREQVEVLDD